MNFNYANLRLPRELFYGSPLIAGTKLTDIGQGYWEALSLKMRYPYKSHAKSNYVD